MFMHRSTINALIQKLITGFFGVFTSFIIYLIFCAN